MAAENAFPEPENANPSLNAPRALWPRGPIVTGLTADSRAVQPGGLFAAFPGHRSDGRAYIGQAIAHGATVILAPTGSRLPANVPVHGDVILIEDEQPRRRFAQFAAYFHGMKQPAVIAAVTGTNGKTSTVQFARQIWEGMGRRAAALGTLGLTAPCMSSSSPLEAPPARAGQKLSMTTPDPVALHQELAVLADAGIQRLAMEASSHGLDQHRLDGVRITAAGFTNLSLDHLDYHGSMDAYFAAKARLFEQVLEASGAAVLNADAPEYPPLAALCARRGIRVIPYGERAAAGDHVTVYSSPSGAVSKGCGGNDAIRVLSVTPLPHGQRLNLNVLGRRLEATLPLVGRFQAWNALCALGLVLASGYGDAGEIDDATGLLSELRGVPGRMQEVARHPSGAPVFVDYAHTPDALSTVLTALRPHAEGRLIVVFGCGGDRDRSKRPIMGEIARRLADRVVVTDDNPRSEEPAEIRRAIMDGCPEALEIGDRAEAIYAAVRDLKAGDLLVIAGKGHEQGQIFGMEVRPFDDAAIAYAAVSEIVDDRHNKQTQPKTGAGTKTQ
ncbi:UDP-N-acetylmuramoyl-L-alanyl-D-glutamate--2, 6-diaminopimelate ligase [Azospirillaceae bacterium]